VYLCIDGGTIMPEYLRRLLAATAVFLSPDEGAGSGGGQAGDPASQSGSSKEGQPDPNKKPDDTSASTADGKDVTVSKTEYDKLYAAHQEMMDKAKKREEAEKKKADDALKEQGKFKELYENLKATSEAGVTTLAKYEAALKGYLEAETKDLSAEHKALIPSGDIASQLEWLTKAKTAGLVGTKKATGDGTPPPGGVNPKSGLSALFKE
jgi:hypothetical protein